MRHGIRTTATVERVAIYNPRVTIQFMASGFNQVHCYCTWMFADEGGRTVAMESRTWADDGIPAPGSTAQVTYRGDRIEWDADTLRAPQAPPRGWAAGVLEAEDWGTHRSQDFDWARDVDAQRELFASPAAARHTAEVVGVERTRHVKRSMSKYALTLHVDGTERRTEAYTPLACVPAPGDAIEVAVTGNRIALDSDPRFRGAPGQALIVQRRTPVAAPADELMQFVLGALR